MTQFVKTSAPVVGFCPSNTSFFLLCGTELIQADAETGAVTRTSRIFPKDGLSRLIVTNGHMLAVSDFCRLSVFRADTPERTADYTLGTDLTTDICGLYMDGDNVYASIRNGKIARIRLSDGARETFGIGAAGSWSLTSCGDGLAAGTVDGKLLLMEKDTMRIVRQLQLSRQNVKSLRTAGNLLYAAGQDKKLYIIDMTRFEVIREMPHMHRLMFDVIGTRDGILYTVSHPACEIRGWAEDGTLRYSLPYRLRLSGSSCIRGDALYISSRCINGIDRLDLADIPAVER